MKFLLSYSVLYPEVPDPYDNGRRCFSAAFLDRTAMHHLIEDKHFLHYSKGTIYFDAEAFGQ